MRLTTIILIATVFASCTKEEVKPDNNVEPCYSVCGTVVGFHEDEAAVYYAIEVENECTKNRDLFDVGFQTYFFTNQGDEYCSGEMW